MLPVWVGSAALAAAQAARWIAGRHDLRVAGLRRRAAWWRRRAATLLDRAASAKGPKKNRLLRRHSHALTQAASLEYEAETVANLYGING